MNDKNEKEKLDIDFTSVDRFVKVVKVVGIGVIIPFVLFIILVIVATIFILNMYWHVNKESIIEHLEEIYQGKYEIISKDVDEKGNGYYKIAVKNNKEIIFNGYHKGNSVNRDDLQAHKLKYYFEKLEDNELKQTFEPLESYYKINETDEQEFLKYELATSINSYKEFDEIVLNCYKLLEYCKNQEIRGYTILLNYNNYGTGFGQNDEGIDYQTLLDREKNNYIRYLVDRNASTNEIPTSDIEKIYRPQDLELILNGKNLGKDYNVRYNDEIKEYEIHDFQKLVENIDNIEKVEYNKGIVSKIKYNNKIYKLHYSNRELKKNSIPYVCRISYIEQLFDAKIKYDYLSKIIYINL